MSAAKIKFNYSVSDTEDPGNIHMPVILATGPEEALKLLTHYVEKEMGLTMDDVLYHLRGTEE